MTNDAIREIHRSRWRREHERLGFIDIRQQGFARGGLGQYVSDLTVRLVILGGDPERDLIEFDDEFWSWWKGNHVSPFGRATEDWERLIPTTHAAVRYHPHSSRSWDWGSYIALCRNGGLDMGLGREGAAVTSDHKRIFRLVGIVGRLWTALDLYREAVERFNINGPWECSVALLGTSGSMLCNFATGWAEYPDPDANPRSCPEPNLWRRWEMHEWPAQDATKDIAFAAGAWIENSWGMQVRRFIAHSGSLEGQFDVSCYR